MLIPKKYEVENMKDYRPISLVGSIYKILAKVRANRLKKVIEEIISESQHAFEKGRQILDATLIANEAIKSVKNKGIRILYKLDIEKV